MVHTGHPSKTIKTESVQTQTELIQPSDQSQTKVLVTVSVNPQATTQATTEATTQATTEATTQATTEATTATSTQATTATSTQPFQTSPIQTMSVLKFKRTSGYAFAPEKHYQTAAGYDLKSAYNYLVPARGLKLISTDLKIQVPFGTYGRLAPRSGLALRAFIDVGAGVVDADYKGIVSVILFNHSFEDFQVLRGDRIAQLICEKIDYPELIEDGELYDDDTDTVDSERGARGLGSTGLH